MLYWSGNVLTRGCTSKSVAIKIIIALPQRLRKGGYWAPNAHRVDELAHGRDAAERKRGAIVAVLIGRLARVVSQIGQRHVAHVQCVAIAAILRPRDVCLVMFFCDTVFFMFHTR